MCQHNQAAVKSGLALLVLKHLQQAGTCNSRATLAETVWKGASPACLDTAAATLLLRFLAWLSRSLTSWKVVSHFPA